MPAKNFSFVSVNENMRKDITVQDSPILYCVGRENTFSMIRAAPAPKVILNGLM